MNCKCGNIIPAPRVAMGYRTCTSCSDEQKWSVVPIIHHKTGNEFQVVKDPEVAAEFMAKSARTGFGTLKGMTGSWKKHHHIRSIAAMDEELAETSNTEAAPAAPTAPTAFHRVVAKKKVETDYQDEKVAIEFFQLLDTDGAEIAKAFLEAQFKALKLSPLARKQLLYTAT